MHRKLFLVLFCLLVAVFSAAGINAAIVYGSGASQTIPTRTPTPAPPTATLVSGGNNPTPTATTQPEGTRGPTPTSTLLPVNIAPTPVGGFLPTAVPCGSSPTIQTLGATNVRSGPGLEYAIIGDLVFLEVRNIVGRAETAAWWFIQFNEGQLGWVANEVVNVQGYTLIVPIVEAPPLNGSTPTPGALWNPTPPPFCTVTPPPTDTPTAVPTAPVAEENESEPDTTLPPTEPVTNEVLPTSTPIVQATAVPLNPTAPTASTDAADESGSSSLGLILLGVGAVLGAAIFFFFRQKRG
jgi:hypothetical protein